jgi:hypothetical protein
MTSDVQICRVTHSNEAARGFYAHHALSERAAVVYERALD